MLFDSWFDSFRGVIGMVQMRGGTLQKGQSIEFASTGTATEDIILDHLSRILSHLRRVTTLLSAQCALGAD